MINTSNSAAFRAIFSFQKIILNTIAPATTREVFNDAVFMLCILKSMCCAIKNKTLFEHRFLCFDKLNMT